MHFDALVDELFMRFQNYIRNYITKKITNKNCNFLTYCKSTKTVILLKSRIQGGAVLPRNAPGPGPEAEAGQ